MTFLPICLHLRDARIVVVGGGRVAEQKLRTLLQFTRMITVVAPRVCAAIHAAGVTVQTTAYEPACLDGATLVYACTNDAAVNARVCADAHARGQLVCVADAPALCDFVSPAVVTHDGMVVAVSSHARQVRRAVAWRDRIKELLDDDQFDGL
jgi:precorrin-2 dehydrogenase/sirohydrochlorin ferrochelatase